MSIIRNRFCNRPIKKDCSMCAMSVDATAAFGSLVNCMGVLKKAIASSVPDSVSNVSLVCSLVLPNKSTVRGTTSLKAKIGLGLPAPKGQSLRLLLLLLL